MILATRRQRTSWLGMIGIVAEQSTYPWDDRATNRINQNRSDSAIQPLMTSIRSVALVHGLASRITQPTVRA